MARGVRGENKPTRDGKTVRKSRGETNKGAIFGCEPGVEVSTAGPGVCEGPAAGAHCCLPLLRREKGKRRETWRAKGEGKES